MTEPLLPDEKPTFLDLWQEHGLGVRALASIAGVHMDAIHTMLCDDIPRGGEDARPVLEAVSRLTGKHTRLTMWMCCFVMRPMRYKKRLHA